jgi:hypothetical protein
MRSRPDPTHLRAALGLHLTLPMLYDDAGTSPPRARPTPRG